MQTRDFERILNDLPEIGIFIIREDNRELLYFNRKMEKLSPQARVGTPGSMLLSGLCGECPIMDGSGEQEFRSVGYSDAFGGVIDIVASRLLWEEGVPAFLVTVTPRLDTIGVTYRKILRVDLLRDRCGVLKSDPEGFLAQGGGASFTQQMDRFVRSGVLHPDDVERFAAFTRLDAMRAALLSERKAGACIYRRRARKGWRWNLAELVPASGSTEEAPVAVLSIKDVDDVLREGLELVQSQRDMQLAVILKSRFSMLNTVSLEDGQCERISLGGTAGLQQNTLVGDYDYYIQQALARFIHPDDAERCRDLLSLDHLRERAGGVEDYLEEVCQYRTREDPVRWLEQRVIYTRHGDSVMVNILGQDITREKSQQDQQQRTIQDRTDIIASLNKLFFSTYYVDLEHDTFRPVTQLSRVGDVLGGEVNCTAAMHIYANNFIHPDDRAEYLRIMDVTYWREHLRWWSPSVEVEYRLLPEGPDGGAEPYKWVRATAALARVGADDLPRTLVYVAQDITRAARTAREHI